MFLMLKLFRTEFTANSSRGELFANDEYFSYTLEDAVRHPKVKIQGMTAIPDGTYQVKVTLSNRFKKMMPEILNVPGFSGIRIHGGNDDGDTDGCILVAENKASNEEDGDLRIQGSKSGELTDLISRYDKCYITIKTVGNV